MFVLQQPTGGLKSQVCSLTYELAVTCQWTKVNSRILLRAVDDSTLNIALCIIIIIIIITNARPDSIIIIIIIIIRPIIITLKRWQGGKP